jgi:hypothetical protein
MTENVTGYGATLAYGAATGASLPAFGSDSYTTVLDIEDLTPPEGSRPSESYKVLDTKAAKKIVGSLEFGACTFTLARAFDLASHDQLEDDANAGTAVRRNFRITLPNVGNEIRHFVGYVSKFALSSITNDGRIQASVEITVDCDVTITR